MNESPRLIAFHQYSGPVAMLLLGFAAVILAAAAGLAVVRDIMDGPSFIAFSGQFFGLLGIALGVSKRNGEGRAADSTTVTTATPEGTTTATRSTS